MRLLKPVLCPYCQKEMIRGFVSAPSYRNGGSCKLYWENYEKAKKSRMTDLFVRQRFRTIVLNTEKEYNGMPGVISYRCPDCKKIIMDTYVEED